MPARKPTVKSLKDSETVMGPHGQRLIYHIANKICGSEKISGCVVVMPPNTHSRAHVHHEHELIVVCVEGRAATLLGKDMKPAYHGPGEFMFIPPGVEHAAVNLSPTDRLVAFEFRSDPHFNKDFELTPHLEETVSKIVKNIRNKIAKGTIKLPEHWNEQNAGVYQFSEI